MTQKKTMWLNQYDLRNAIYGDDCSHSAAHFSDVKPNKSLRKSVFLLLTSIDSKRCYSDSVRERPV